MHDAGIRPLGALAALLTCLAAAGCAGGGGPGPDPLPAAPLAEVISSAAATTGPGSGSAARISMRVVRRYYSALNGLHLRMRTGPLADLMARGCPCRAQLAAVRAAIRRGEHYTDRVRILSMAAHQDRPDLVDVVVTIDVTHGGLADRLGRRVHPQTTARDVHREFLLRLEGGRWLITEVLAV